METYAIEKAAGFVIYRTALRMKSALHRAFKDKGFESTPEQWGVLRLLWEDEGLSQKEIGNRLFKDKPNVTRLLDALEKKKLIFRQPADRRTFAIFLTKEGKKLQKELLPIVLALQKKAIQGLSESDLNTLHRLLNQIYRNLS